MALRPTRVRHEVVGVATLMAVLLYLDRNCLPLVATYVGEDLNLSDQGVGLAMSAFYLTYALGQVPSGWLTDRFGGRLTLTLYILGWSLFMGLTGAAVGLLTLLVGRLGMGLGQAGAYPTAANLISKWVPFSNRGFASSVVSFGGRLGGFLAPVLTAYLILAFTPLEAPSLLKPDDLLDTPRLCSQLAAPNTASGDASRSRAAERIVAERVNVLLGAERPAVEALAAQYDRDRSQPKRAGMATSQDRFQRSAPPPSFDETRFLRQLNAILRERHAFSYLELNGLPLQEEADPLLQRNPETLSQPEVERLNRLIVEAAFPESIAKVYRYSWRPVMFLYGFIGAAIAAACWCAARNRPEEHPRVNQEELDLIRYSRPLDATSPEGMARGLPWKGILSSRSLWLSCVSQCATNIGWMFLVSWMPTYLERVHQVPLAARGWLITLVLLIGALGMLFGGALTDRLVRTLGLRWGRALPMGLTRFAAMGAYLACLYDLPTWAVVAALSLVAFATDLGVAATWAFCQDVGGKHVGSVLGWGNMWGNFGAFVTPTLLIWLVGDGYSWDRAFLACAASFFVAGVAGLAIDATVPVAAKEK